MDDPKPEEPESTSKDDSNSEADKDSEASSSPEANSQSQQTSPEATAESSPPPPVTVSPSQSDTRQGTVGAQKKSNKKPWLLLVMFVVLVAAGALIYVGFHNNKTSNTGTTRQDIPLIKYAFYNNPLNVFYPSDQSVQGPAAVQYQIFEGLVSYKNGTQIVPNLASSWSNPNDTTWVFKLKPNIYYHDGDTVTAQDVVNSWKQVSQTQVLSTYITNTIKDVTALNNSTVEITTTQPDAILLNRLAQMFIIDSKAPTGTKPWQLGTGAYTVKPNTTPSNNNIDLVAFSKWHSGHIYTKEVDYIFYADPNQSASALESGKVNLSDGLSYSQVSNKLKQGYNVFNSLQIAVNSVIFNSLDKNSPTSNPKIRQAFLLAVNPGEVLTQAQQAGIVVNQAVPPSIPGYSPSIKTVTQNITQAAALVKAAGYSNGVTINLGVGEPIESVAQEIAKEVKPAGINVNVQVATDEGQYFNTVNSGGYQAFIAEEPSSVLDGSDILGYYSNPGFYTSSTFTSELNNASTIFDAAQRLKVLQSASLTLYQDNEYIPLYQVSDINASDKGLVFPVENYDGDVNTFFADVYKQN